MRITATNCFGYELHHAYGEYVISGNRAASSEVSTLVRVQTTEGLSGRVEITPVGDLCLQTLVRDARRVVYPRAPPDRGGPPPNLCSIYLLMNGTLLGGALPSPQSMWPGGTFSGRQPVRPFYYFSAAFYKGVPLHETVPPGAPAEIAAFVSQCKKAGSHRFQVTVDHPHCDVARTRAVVEVTEQDTLIMTDSDRGFKPQGRTGCNTRSCRPPGLHPAAVPPNRGLHLCQEAFCAAAHIGRVDHDPAIRLPCEEGRRGGVDQH